MPTYEYQCPDGHVFEKFQKMSDKPRAKCPVCEKSAQRKISGGAGLVFKGTGFYITDYGKDGKGPRKEAAERTEKTEKTERAERADKAEKSAGPAEGSKKSEKPIKSAPSQHKGKAAPE